MTKRRIPCLVPDGLRSRIETEQYKPKRTGRTSDAERLQAEPWRATGYGSEYRRVRQAVIASQGGKCGMTGQQVATCSRGVWRITQPGAGVHHRVALCDGGTEAPGNLVLLSASAHARLDAQRRGGEGSQ